MLLLHSPLRTSATSPQFTRDRLFPNNQLELISLAKYLLKLVRRFHRQGFHLWDQCVMISTRHPQATKKKRKPNLINRLPNELLLNIFSFYVWTSCGSPVHLLLVCKLWENISSHPHLWANLYYGDFCYQIYSPQDEGVAQRIEEKGFIHCWSSESLNLAMKKTKSSTFELTVCRSPTASSWSFRVEELDKAGLSQRCRLIRFINDGAYAIFVPLLAEVPLLALEEFIYAEPWWSENFNNASLTKNLHENSPLLWNLSASMLESQPAFRSLLPRLSKVHTHNIDRVTSDITGDGVVLEKLEELKLAPNQVDHDLDSDLGQSRELQSMPALKRVTIEEGSLCQLPSQSYTQLTHLTLRWLHPSDAKVPVSFPLLIYLCVEGPWQYVCSLDAPMLVTLYLRCGEAPRDQGEKMPSDSLEHVTLIPRILHIDKVIPQGDILAFLSKNGENLEEISITYMKLNETISDTLTTALVGGKKKAAVCPLLRKIEVMTIFFDKKTKAERDSLFQATKQRLQRVVDKRAPEGILIWVRHGCYPLASRKRMFELPNRRYWAFKWFEIL